MGSNKDIAEERLLRLIEGTEEAGPGTARMKRPLFRFSSLTRAIRRWRLALPFKEDRLLSSLEVVSSFLWIVLAGMGIYLAMNLTAPQAAVSGVSISMMPRGLTTEETAPVKVADKLLAESEYVGIVEARNPFTAKSEVETVVEAKSIEPTSAEIMKEMANGLVVVAINRGAVKDAIIEDSIMKRSFFVKNGDKVKDLTVKEIKNDTVVLSYEGEELEIG